MAFFSKEKSEESPKFSFVSGLTAISQDFTYPRVLSELCTAEECVLQKNITWSSSSQNRLLQLLSMFDLNPNIEANTLI